MEQVKISEDQIVPMDDIAPGIQGLRIGFVNVFGVRHSASDWTLIDAGLPFTAAFIRKWAEKHFGSRPNGILLTHGHFDHVSGASELALHWNVPIYAHPLEGPYLTGQQSYPPPDTGAGGGLMSLLSPMYPRGPVNLGDHLRLLSAFDEATEIEPLPRWNVLHTSGHTPGHISLFRASDRTLIAGDAFCTTKPESFFDAALTEPAELHGPPAYFTSEWHAAQRSIRRLASLYPQVLVPGHGRPVAGAEVEAKFSQFAAEFSASPEPKSRRAA